MYSVALITESAGAISLSFLETLASKRLSHCLLLWVADLLNVISP